MELPPTRWCPPGSRVPSPLCPWPSPSHAPRPCSHHSPTTSNHRLSHSIPISESNQQHHLLKAIGRTQQRFPSHDCRHRKKAQRYCHISIANMFIHYTHLHPLYRFIVMLANNSQWLHITRCTIPSNIPCQECYQLYSTSNAIQIIAHNTTGLQQQY